MVILDTDCMSLLERDNAASSVLRRRLATASDVATTIVNFEEQMRGWLAYVAKSREMEQQIAAYAQLYRFLENYRTITVLPFEDVAAAELRNLQARKIRIGTMDLKIAAIAIAHEALLISRNLADFEQVPQLRVADWTQLS